jgi:hypothetical protein
MKTGRLQENTYNPVAQAECGRRFLPSRHGAIAAASTRARRRRSEGEGQSVDRRKREPEVGSESSSFASERLEQKA